ncbi:MAG: hypothetical protein U5L04_12720 [Trueperaceae bacterium]|nr:hypothetical protein [Trueperaceae bacterium]
MGGAGDPLGGGPPLERGDDAALPDVGGERGEKVVGAAQLKRAGFLKTFGFGVDVVVALRRVVGEPDEGCDDGDAGEPFCGGVEIVEGDGVIREGTVSLEGSAMTVV